MYTWPIKRGRKGFESVEGSVIVEEGGLLEDLVERGGGWGLGGGLEWQLSWLIAHLWAGSAG